MDPESGRGSEEHALLIAPGKINMSPVSSQYAEYGPESVGLMTVFPILVHRSMPINYFNADKPIRDDSWDFTVITL